MKTIKTLLIACFTLLLTLGVLFYFAFQKMQEDNLAVQSKLNIELRKAISTKQNSEDPKDTTHDIAVMNQKLNQGLLDSINNVLRRGLAKMPIAPPANLQNLYKQISFIEPGTSQQVKIDSLENKVSSLSQLVRTNLAIQAKPIIAEKSEKTKTLQTYYDDINIIFKTRNSFITGKVQPQYFPSLQYGQVFRFVNSIPDYMFAFTDKKGNSISNVEAKEFLSNKSFWLNSIELKEKKAVVNCSIGI